MKDEKRHDERVNEKKKKNTRSNEKFVNPWDTPNKCLESNLNRSEKPKHQIRKGKTQTKSIY